MNKKISDVKIISVIVVFCSAVYLSLVWNSNVWMDEAFTASLAHHSFKEVIYLSMMDTLPPLYNIILWLTTSIFGYTVPVMKITSVLPMIGVMIIAATTLRKRFNLVTASSFILLITAMPLMLNYGVEIRMYSLGFLFATASGIFCYEVICESTFKNWALFTVFSVLAGYSHHFAFVAVGFVYLFLLLYYFFLDRKHIKRWFICLGFTILLYLPCLIVTLTQFSRVSGYFTMPDITLSLFIQYVLYPYIVGITPATCLCILLMFACLLYTAYTLFVKKDYSLITIYSLACFAIYYGVLIFGTIVCKIMTANIFVDRYLFFSTGLLWMIVAITIGRLSKNYQQWAMISLIFILGICSYIVEFKVEYSNSADEEIAFLDENVSYGDIFYGFGGHEEMENCIPFLSLLGEGNDLTFVYPLDNALETANKLNVTLWISIIDNYELSSEEKAMIDNAGYDIEEASDFKFDRYDCKLYKLVRK